jgi:hypothetical protein
MCGCKNKIGSTMKRPKFKASGKFFGLFAASAAGSGAGEASNFLLDKIEAIKEKPLLKGIIKIGIGGGIAYWGETKGNDYLTAGGLGFAGNGVADVVRSIMPEPEPGPTVTGIGNTVYWTDEAAEAAAAMAGAPGEDGIGNPDESTAPVG